MEIAQTIDNALEEWYSERGRPVPKWKKEKQKWWREYLISLGLDPNNPECTEKNILISRMRSVINSGIIGIGCF